MGWRAAPPRGSLKGRSCMGEERVEERPPQNAIDAANSVVNRSVRNTKNKSPEVMLVSFVSASSSL